MCSTSNVNEALGALSSPAAVVPSVSAHCVRQHRSDYYLVDVREASELATTPFADADTAVPLGAICRDASDLIAQVNDDNKTIVCVCRTGVRADLAAQSIVAQSSASIKVAILQRGLVGWDNMAALSPDFVVVLGNGQSTEKLSLALAAVASAVDSYQTVVLVLMSDGVNWFLKQNSSKRVESTVPNVETVEQGAPFKPCKAMLNKFLTANGVVLACTTCFKHRQYSLQNDMMGCVNPMQMPDLIRMLGEASGGSLQFM